MSQAISVWDTIRQGLPTGTTRPARRTGAILPIHPPFSPTHSRPSRLRPRIPSDSTTRLGADRVCFRISISSLRRIISAATKWRTILAIHSRSTCSLKGLRPMRWGRRSLRFLPALSTPPISPALAFPTTPTITYDIGNTGANAFVPQRIRFGYEIDFTSASWPLHSLPRCRRRTQARTPSTLPSAYKGKPTLDSPQAEFFLLGGDDPYFTNVNAGAGVVDPQYYLSQDLRVFTGTPALNNVPGHRFRRANPF